MAFRILEGYKRAYPTEVETRNASTFAQAVDQLTEQRGVVAMDLDKTYIDGRDVIATNLGLQGKEGSRRRKRIEERQAALHKLLEPQGDQQISHLVVWTSRPKILLPKSIRTEIAGIAQQHEVHVSFLAGLDKMMRQRRFKDEIQPHLESGRALHVFGNSPQEGRGARWASRFSSPVTHVNIVGQR